MRLSFLLPVLVLALGCTASGGRPNARSSREVKTMTIHIDLQDGFQNDEVIVRLDGKEVFHKSGVTTDIRISRADGTETAVSKPEVQMEVDLPKKHLRASQRVKPAEASNVGISIRDGKPQFRLQATAFLYM